jgi:protocatechuate 3,4-dioxygenase beta subunit
VKADAQGDLVIKGLYPGVYSLSPKQSTNEPLEAEIPPPIKVQPNSLTEVAIAVKPKAKIGGRIIDRVSGKGVPDVGIQVLATTDEGKSEYRGWVQTDSAGRFSAYTRPGKLSLSFSSTPAGYIRPEEFKEAHTVAAGDSFTFPDIVFEPAVPVEGVVEDSSGRPIPGVLVRMVLASPPYDPFNKNAIYSDAAGRFTLRSLGPKSFAVLRARTPKAVTKGGMPLDVAKQKGPIRLVLSAADAFQLRGCVMDNAGQPVADAAVLLVWRYQNVGQPVGVFNGQQLETYRTDAEGRFQTQALWPGDNYQVKVTAADHGPGESPWVTGEAGRVRDLATITLPRTAGT